MCQHLVDSVFLRDILSLSFNVHFLVNWRVLLLFHCCCSFGDVCVLCSFVRYYHYTEVMIKLYAKFKTRLFTVKSSFCFVNHTLCAKTFVHLIALQCFRMEMNHGIRKLRQRINC